jgi:hypothetical protein
MAIKYGFYNSISGDRTYNATDFGSIFDGIIRDGVFESVYDRFEITIGSGLSVNVGKGKAWFNDTWLESDSVYPVTFTEAELLLNRIDAIVLEFNASEAVRENTIKVIQGNPSSSPVNPTLTRTGLINQYPLCYVNIPPKATSLVAGDIDIRIGTIDCPYTIIESGEIPSLDEITALISKTNLIVTNGDGYKVLTNKGQYKSLEPVELTPLTSSGYFNPTPYLSTYSRFYFVLYGAGGSGGVGGSDTEGNILVGGGGGAGGKTITPPLIVPSSVAYTVGTASYKSAGGDTKLLGYTAGGGGAGYSPPTCSGGAGGTGTTSYGQSGTNGGPRGGTGGSSDVGQGGTTGYGTGYASGGSGSSSTEPNNGRPGLIKVYGLYI